MSTLQQKQCSVRPVSTSLQKAVAEVSAYVNKSVVPEGLTLRPPDPPDSEEDETADRKV